MHNRDAFSPGARPGGLCGSLRWLAGASIVAVALLMAMPARAQMARPVGIEDINWRATLGTGVALETGGITTRDPFLLYFGAEVKKSWRWWYGLTFVTRGDLYTGLAEYPMVPYKLATTGSLALGPHVFRMEVLRAKFLTEFGALYDHSTGTNLRLEASTLPTFTGEVAFGESEEHVVSYFIVPVQLVIGQYSFANHRRVDYQQTEMNHNWRPYPAGKLRGQHRFIATEWLQLHGALSLLKAYSAPEFRMQIDGGASVGILENSVQFSFEFMNDLWYAPDQVWVNTAIFTLSARLRI